MSRRQETEAARDRGRKRPGRKATHCAMGFCKTLTLAHQNGKIPGGVGQKGDSGVEDSSHRERSRGAELSYN